MSDWLVQSGTPSDLVAEMVKEHLKAIILEKFDPIQVCISKWPKILTLTRSSYN